MHRRLSSTSPHSAPRSPAGHLGLAASCAAVALALSACGAIQEKLVEDGAERIVEAETGENVEIDLDGDGSFTIDSDGGGFSVDGDGNIVVTGENGEDLFDGQFDDDGLTVTDENGDQVLDIDLDENGDAAEITFEGEDGSGSFKTTTDIPDEWPTDVVRPTGLDVETGSVIEGDGSVLISISGSAADGSAWVDAYAAALAASGAVEVSSFRSQGSTQAQYTQGNWAIVLGSADETVTVSLFPAEG